MGIKGIFSEASSHPTVQKNAATGKGSRLKRTRKASANGGLIDELKTRLLAREANRALAEPIHEKKVGKPAGQLPPFSDSREISRKVLARACERGNSAAKVSARCDEKAVAYRDAVLKVLDENIDFRAQKMAELLRSNKGNGLLAGLKRLLPATSKSKAAFQRPDELNDKRLMEYAYHFDICRWLEESKADYKDRLNKRL